MWVLLIFFRTVLTLNESLSAAIMYRKVTVGFFAGIMSQANERMKYIGDSDICYNNDSGT